MTDEFLDLSFVREQEEGLFARDIDGQLVRLDPATLADYDKLVRVTIDGKEHSVPKAVPSRDPQGAILRDETGQTIPRATTIHDAAAEMVLKGLFPRNPIPVLCHQEHMTPVAVCRVCVVQIWRMEKGRLKEERKLLPACHHRVEDQMEVLTYDAPKDPPAHYSDEKKKAWSRAWERVRASVGVLTELLTADHLPATPAQAPSANRPGEVNELRALAQRTQRPGSRFSPNPSPRGRDDSSVVIAVDHSQCILCDRCVRACDEVKENNVIGRSGKGYLAHIGFDLDDPMGQSSCVACGECMVSCPTGALTFRQNLRPDPWKDEKPHPEPVPVEELTREPIFAGISPKFLQWTHGSVIRRKVKKGDVLCREGDFGSTAFLLRSGGYEVALHTSLGRVENVKGSGLLNWLGRAVSTLTSARDREFEKERPNAAIRSEGGAALTPARKAVILRPPETLLIGEMACLNNYPRSATVTAAEDGEVWEMLRNVLYLLQRNKASRSVLETVYRKRALNDLRALPVFAGLEPEQRDRCAGFLLAREGGPDGKSRAELIRLEPGQVLFHQNEPADHFYLIRLGFVKVSQTQFGQSRVLSYLGPGDHFGEIGLLSAASDLVKDQVPEGMRLGTRTATCTALDHVELIRIRGEDFRKLVEEYADLRERLIKASLFLLERDRASRKNMDQSLGEFLNQGLQNANKLLVLDLERCTRCDECTRACADTHPDANGVGVTRLIREGLRYDRFLVATACRSCLDPVCMIGCPVGSIRRDKNLEIVIEPWCIGCTLCANQCPYGNIHMHEQTVSRDDPHQSGRKVKVAERKATTCDLCRNIVGNNEDPSCVYACPHDAAFRMSGPELLEKVGQKAPKSAANPISPPAPKRG